MENNVISLIQQQTEQTFSNSVNATKENNDIMMTTAQETQQSIPSQEDQNTSTLNNIGLEVQRQGGV